MLSHKDVCEGGLGITYNVLAYFWVWGKDSLLLKETEVKQGIEQTSPTHMFILVKGSKATIFESEIPHIQEAVIEYA